MNAAAAQVPLTAIMNPGNGPGNSVDSNYISVVNSLRAAGGHVLGYVYTSYAARSLSQVLTDVDRYKSWYNVDGIFVDEMANSGLTTNLDYYRDIYNHVKAIDVNWSVMGNPGTNTLESCLTWPTADRLMVQENIGSLYPGYVPSAWNYNYAPSRFVHLVHTEASAANMLNDLQLALQYHAGGIFITDDVLDNPWDQLPTYWTQLVNAVATINADFNSDGTVDAADYVVWRHTVGQTGLGLAADADGDGTVTTADLTLWRNHFGETAGSGTATTIVAAVPEPTPIWLLAVSIVALSRVRISRRLADEQ